LELLAKHSFDIIVLETDLPEVDGPEVVRRIRADAISNVPPKIPIVALTSHAMNSEYEAFQAAGVDAFIRKPAHLQELLETIERLGLAAAATLFVGNSIDVSDKLGKNLTKEFCGIILKP